MEYISRISWRYNMMSKKNKMIADYILLHKNEVKHLSISQLAVKVQTNAPAITRFAQFLGFKGFTELKFYLEKEILTSESPNNLISSADSIDMIKQKLIQQDNHIISDTLSLVDSKRINLIAKSLLSASKIEMFAEGGSSATLSALYTVSLNFDLPARKFADAFLAINAASQLKPLDVALCISYSGSSINGVNFLKEARLRKATTISITGYTNSPLAKTAELNIFTSTKFNNNLRDLHGARMSEMCVVGLLENILFSKVETSHVEKMNQISEATRKTRFKSGYDILF